MTAAAIEIRIEHAFGRGFRLDIEFDATARSVALFGPSGSGKSSVLRAIAGLWVPERARIAVDGVVFLDTERGVALPPRSRRVGFVPQESWLFPLLSVRENLEFGRPREPVLSTDAVATALGIELLLDRRPRMLSGGERQRVALGRAVLSEPAVLLCDEPFSALDSGRRDELLHTVRDWRAQRDTVLVFVSHQMEEVTAVADRMARLRDGRVVAEHDVPSTDLND